MEYWRRRIRHLRWSGGSLLGAPLLEIQDSNGNWVTNDGTALNATLISDAVMSKPDLGGYRIAAGESKVRSTGLAAGDEFTMSLNFAGVANTEAASSILGFASMAPIKESCWAGTAADQLFWIGIGGDYGVRAAMPGQVVGNLKDGGRASKNGRRTRTAALRRSFALAPTATPLGQRC